MLKSDVQTWRLLFTHFLFYFFESKLLPKFFYIFLQFSYFFKLVRLSAIYKYFCSGLEAEGTILSTKQFDTSVKRKHDNSNVEKCLKKEESPINPNLERNLSIVPVKVFKEKALEKFDNQFSFDHPQGSDSLKDELFDCDIPDLEFLDYDDVGIKSLPEDIVYGRSPFVPSPMADVELKVDHNVHLLKRAPHIPFTCIMPFCFENKELNPIHSSTAYVR